MRNASRSTATSSVPRSSDRAILSARVRRAGHETTLEPTPKPSTRSLTAGLALAAAALGGHPAFAQDARAMHVRALAATCASCHGTDGRAHADSATASLAGMPRIYLAAQMRDFRDGKRSATVMHQIAKGYTDEQIDTMAAYFAAQSK
jgi:sulfide dehydrogenase cytochrome subunit